MWPEPALRVATPPADDVIDPLRYDITCAADESAETAAGDGQVSTGARVRVRQGTELMLVQVVYGAASLALYFVNLCCDFVYNMMIGYDFVYDFDV